MTYKATQDVVRRVMPLLDRLATRSVDKARLLQYLSASVGVEWGVLQRAGEQGAPDARVIIFRDVGSGAEHALPYPAALTPELEPLVLAEYKRLALGKPLTRMDARLFDHFYALTHCARCVYRGVEHAQIHSECYFAGNPVNFEAER